MSRDARAGYVAEVREEYAQIAAAHARGAGGQGSACRSRTRARMRSSSTGRALSAAEAELSSAQCSKTIRSRSCVDYIDWTPFFSDLGVDRQFPAILDDDKCRRRRRARSMTTRRRCCDKIVDENWFKASAVVGFWPANAAGDDIVVYGDEAREQAIATLHTLRQQIARREGRANVALADFVAPHGSGVPDYVGGFVVTAGIGEDEVADRFKRANDDYSAIMVKALADRLAEAFAERLHQRVRKEFWGYAPDETLEHRRSDRGEISRHPPGAGLSGAARSHREGHAVPAARGRAHRREADRELRDVAGRVGLRALFQPSARAHYFGVGKIERDQVEDYARRKGWSVGEVRALAGADPQLRCPRSPSIVAAYFKTKDTGELDLLRCLLPLAGFTPAIYWFGVVVGNVP